MPWIKLGWMMMSDVGGNLRLRIARTGLLSGVARAPLRQLVGLAALAAGLLRVEPAEAIYCDQLDLPNKIFGIGGSAVTATLRRIAIAIANDTTGNPAERIAVFYTDPNACEGYREFLTGTTIRNFKYWVAGDIGNPLETDRTCEAQIGGQPLDFAHMGNDADFCSEEVPDGVGDFLAPVQTLNLITSVYSNEDSISAEALYFIFGFGPMGRASPWTDGTGIFPPSPAAFLSQLLGEVIGVPPDRFYPWQTDAGAGSIATYAGAGETRARQTLGYVSGSTADAARGKNTVKTLAYQHYDQVCGVYPDSTATAFDKLNVRLGKYVLWSAGHFFTAVDAGGKPENPRVENFLGWFGGETRAPGTGVDALAEIVKAASIPQCAMQATREGTFGAFSSYQSPKPCGCFFEAVASGSSDCDACTTDADCGAAAPRCNFGFCETYRAAEHKEG